MKKIAIRFIAFFLVFAVAGNTITNALYLHSHRLPDGSVITHAHPFNKTQDKSPYKHHRHTQVELFLLSHLHLLFSGAMLMFLLVLSGRSIAYLILSERKGYHALPSFSVTRPPPTW